MRSSLQIQDVRFNAAVTVAAPRGSSGHPDERCVRAGRLCQPETDAAIAELEAFVAETRSLLAEPRPDFDGLCDAVVPARARSVALAGPKTGSAADDSTGATRRVAGQRARRFRQLWLKELKIVIIAGPMITMNTHGKMNRPVGSTIFTGAFVARSSAAMRRR